MDTPTINTLIGAGGSVIVAVTALLLNYRGFVAIDNRMSGLEARMTAFDNRIDARLNLMQSSVSSLQTDVALLKGKAGL